MNEIQAYINHPVSLLFVGAVIGAILEHVFLKFRNKTSVLGYTRSVVRVGVSADDAIFGSIRVMLGENPVRNLFLCTIEVENMSSIDHEDVELKIYTGNDTLLYNVEAILVDSPYVVPFTEDLQISSPFRMASKQRSNNCAASGIKGIIG